MAPADWPEVRAIYEDGIATGVATFETAAPSWELWNASRLPHSRLVARGGVVLGWAALSAVSQRVCYAGVAEVAVYVGAAARGQGVGALPSGGGHCVRRGPRYLDTSSGDNCREHCEPCASAAMRLPGSGTPRTHCEAG